MDRNITLREGLKGKTFLEKIDYLWTYYKIHIIAIFIINLFPPHKIKI